MPKSIIAYLLTIAALAPAAAFASDGTASFNGTVVAQTCVINGGAPNFTVTMPKVSTASMAYVNGGYTKGGDTVFKINLTGCATDGGARASFEAGPGVGAGGLLKNTGTAGVQIELFNALGSSIVPGAASGNAQNNGQFVPITNGNATLTYGARYISGVSKVAPGTVVASVTYSIEYQ